MQQQSVLFSVSSRDYFGDTHAEPAQRHSCILWRCVTEVLVVKVVLFPTNLLQKADSVPLDVLAHLRQSVL